jgi:CRP-like cAMP-binding protein
MLEHPFLQGLTPVQHEMLAALFAPVEWTSHEVVFRQGDSATYAYLLIAGGVSIRYKPYDGPKITVTRLHAEDVFGWSAIIGNASYASDAIVTAPARALRARGVEIRQVCGEYPATGAQILEQLALAVAPRWLNAQEQVRRLLKQEILKSGPRPQVDIKP